MAKIMLLDGGMGQELIQRAGDKPTPLWATQVMMDRPGLVQEVHSDYFKAGATIATTNTYALLPDRLSKAGIEDSLSDLRDAALTEVKAAQKVHGSGRIAGAIGPLGASYRPDVFPEHSAGVAAYSAVVTALAPEVDLILYETVASVAHAKAALEAAQNCGKPVWLAVTVDDQNGTLLRSGEKVSEVAALSGADAFLANCSAPEVMGDAIDALLASGKPVGAYANGFTQITNDFLKDSPTVDALQKREDITPARYAEFALDWVNRGATIVGGCCETGPDHIAALAARLIAEGHDII